MKSGSRKQKRKRMLRSAAKAPRWVRDVAGSKWSPRGQARHRSRQLGRTGAASEVRVIVKDGVPLEETE